LIRSFLAIELPEVILKRVEEIQEDLRSSGADVRWVNVKKIHLTLKFLGNIEESQIDPIVKAIEGPIRSTPSFLLTVRGTGAFPHLRNPRVVWMGLFDESGRLISLQKQLESVLEKLGFQPENRPFQPHLTLGRVNSSRGKEALAEGIERYKGEEIGGFEVEKVIFFKSDLRPSGPIYTPLREVKLAQG
jgi:RNA 2',3'-cyclic 3'-phosphodiesterase